MDYKGLKREELRSICKSKGIRHTSHMRKSQMIQLLQAWRPAAPPLSPLSEEDVAEEQAQMMAADAQVPPLPLPRHQHSKKPVPTLLTALLCGHYPLLTAAVFAQRPCKKLNGAQGS